MTKTILITGASSGLGFAIAEEYAKRGLAKKIYLLARSAKRLKLISEVCKLYDCSTETIVLDVMDKETTTRVIAEITKKDNIDIVIANSGVSENSLSKAGIKENFAELILSTNINGILNTITPVLLQMKNNKTGRIAIVGSIAGFLHMANSVPYCASKAAINNYASSLRIAAKPYNVQVSLILPGFVDTPMIDSSSFSTPLKFSASKAAKIIVSGIEARKGIIAFPLTLYFAAKLLNILPYRLADYISSKIIDRKI